MTPQRNLALKKKLLDLNRSQKSLSRKTDIGENYISLILSGRYLPNENQQMKIADALNCKPEEIFN